MTTTDNTNPPLEPEYTLAEIAEACRRSPRWVWNRVKAGEEGKGPAIEHIRRGASIHMTREQVEKFRELDLRKPQEVPAESITTGKKKSA